MILKQLFVAVPVALLVLVNGTAKAGQIINELGSVWLRERQVGCEGARKRTQAG